MKKMTRILSLVLCLALALPCAVYANIDDSILLDPVQNTYTGREQAMDLKNALNYSDVPVNYPQREAIVQGGALGVMRGEMGLFYPETILSKAVAIASIIKEVGLDSAAIEERQKLGDKNWYSGYLSLAASMNIISKQDLLDSQADQSTLDPTKSFNLNAPATREEVAKWLVLGVNYVKKETFTMPTSYQKLYVFEDVSELSAEALPYVEIVTVNGIIPPVENGKKFNPAGTMTRADMAQILKNCDPFQFTALGMEKKTGTVSAVTDNTERKKNTDKLIRSLYIRTSDGKVDVIEYELKSKTDPRPNEKDIVVYDNGRISGVDSLNVGDKIEYIVKTSDKTIFFIKRTNSLVQEKITVYYVGFDSANKTITVSDKASEGKKETYNLADGIMTVDKEKSTVVMKQKDFKEINQDTATLANGSKLELTLMNKVVTELTYVGEYTVAEEFYGVVTENDPDLGYLSFINSNGKEITKKYYSNELKVQKRPYYADQTNDVGYIDQIFPGFRYNPNTTTVDSLDEGDIIYVRLDPNDNDVITAISAVTNYLVKYGKVRQIQKDGDTADIVLEYENKQTTLISVPYDTFVSQSGIPKAVESILAGDWIRILVNEATIAPGYTATTVIEIMVEGNEHFIEQIIYGQLAGFDPIQKKMSIQNYQLLAKTGWTNYSKLVQLDLSSRDVEYYYGNKKITLDYALNYLKRSNADVYIAMEKSYSGVRVKKVTFRVDRNDILEPDTIVDAKGTGEFTMFGTMEKIAADDGTIIRRYGRLVDKSAISASDYARVVQTSGNVATIVDIYDAPASDGVQIVRGRIKSIDDGKSFQVQSMATFTGVAWSYTPIERLFTIDYSTQFINSTGNVGASTFIGYGDNSKIDKVYTIIVDGQKAVKVIDAAYPTQAIRGTIYAANGTSLSLKNVSHYDQTTGRWIPVGDTLSINVAVRANDGIVIKNNEVVSYSNLVVGDQIRVMTTNLPNRYENNTTIVGYMTFVEK